MKNSKKLILVMLSIICIVILLVGSIAYYRIVVNGSIKGSTGNAVFVLRDSDNSVWNNKVIDLGKINPGDSGEFTVTMDASGSSVDMYATLEIERTNLPTNLKFYTTSDHKSELHKYYSFLEKNGTNSETLTIYWYWNPYIDDVEDNKFINVSNLEANIRVSAVQISEYAMMKNGFSYSTSGGTEFWNNTYKPYIRMINFGNDLSNLPSSCTEENLCWDISYSTSQKKKVYGYLIDSGLTISETDSSTSTTVEKTLYNLYIVSEAPIFASTSCNGTFSSFKNLIQINFNNNFNTSKVTNMHIMFYFCSSLISLDLSNFNTSKAKDMGAMFLNCKSLVSINLSNFNTSNVTDMGSMFSQCSSLTSLGLSSFTTSNVTNMYGMFMGCYSFISLDLSSFNTFKVTNMQHMFEGCSSLTSLDLSSFNTSKVTDMSYMFSALKLSSLDLSNFNTFKVTNMQYMFYSCSSLTNLNLSSFNTSNVTNMYGMFMGCYSFISLDLSSFNTSNVTNMGSMFSSCSRLASLDLSNFNTSKVTNMSYMFRWCSNLQTEINITNTGTTDYSSMFSGALTDANAYVVLGYTTDTQSIVEAMKSTAPTVSQSKITLKQI